ncbi:hypothetical protein Hanom_Chr04g00383751 [Helianthus anomalus]
MWHSSKLRIESSFFVENMDSYVRFSITIQWILGISDTSRSIKIGSASNPTTEMIRGFPVMDLPSSTFLNTEAQAFRIAWKFIRVAYIERFSTTRFCCDPKCGAKLRDETRAFKVSKNVPPAVLLRFLREHRSEWADFNVDAYLAASVKASPCMDIKGHGPRDLQMFEVIRLEGHVVGQEDPFVSRDIHLSHNAVGRVLDKYFLSPKPKHRESYISLLLLFSVASAKVFFKVICSFFRIQQSVKHMSRSLIVVVAM